MKMIYFAWLLVIALLVSGCGGADVEPPAEPAQGEEEGGALSTVPPQETDTPAVEPTLPPTFTAEPEEDADGEPVAPVTVDLSEITPETSGSDDPVVMPAPGVPNPGVSMSNRAAQHLAKELEIDVSEIEVVSIEDVTWANSSLGCPEPGMNYLTVLTPGYRIMLSAQGEQYEYHTDQSQYVVQCEGGEPVSNE